MGKNCILQQCQVVCQLNIIVLRQCSPGYAVFSFALRSRKCCWRVSSISFRAESTDNSNAVVVDLQHPIYRLPSNCFLSWTTIFWINSCTNSASSVGCVTCFTRFQTGDLFAGALSPGKKKRDRMTKNLRCKRGASYVIPCAVNADNDFRSGKPVVFVRLPQMVQSM